MTGFGSCHQGWVLLIVMGAVEPLSRMYLGAHSANQVLFGLVLGFLFLVAYKYVYQKGLYKFFWNLLVKPIGFLKLILLVGCHVLVIVIPIIFFMINEKERPVEKRFLDHVCGASMTSIQLQS